MGQTCAIDIKGYICILGTVIRKSEANILVECQLGIQIEKIRGIPDL